MWWLAPNFSDGAEFEFAAPSLRPFAWRCYWTGRIYPPLHLPPLGLVEWMTMSHCGGLVLADWWVIDVMADCGGSGAEEEPSPQEQEKIQECWGWWRGSPHLSQWRHAESEMYRIYTFFYFLLFTLFLSHSLVVWFLFPNINLEAEVFGPIDLIFFFLVRFGLSV